MDEAGFLEAIVAEPHDDAHRLVFADWLDDHGESAHAAFIRDQVALARMDEADPRYPALLARSRRGGMLTAPRRRPMLDHVPGGGVLFRRGLIDGVEVNASAFLRQPSERWGRVVLDQLSLDVDGDEEGKELARREELRRVRTLCFADYLDREECEPLLTDCPHLANLRALRLPRQVADEALLNRLALPALDSLAVDGGSASGGWEALVPRRGPALRRIALTGYSTEVGNRTWEPPTLDWLLRSRHGPTLEEAYVRRDSGDDEPGYGSVYAVPLRDPSLLSRGRLRRVEVAGPSAARLASATDWGRLEHLAIRGEIGQTALDRVLSSPQTLRLRSLLIESLGSDFENAPMPLLRQADRPAWTCLRLIDWSPDLLAACSEGLLRLSVNDLAADLTFAQAGLTFPELRFLLLDVDEPPRNLPKLIAGLRAPNLCTLVLLGIEPSRAATIGRLARLEGMPHFSLVGAGQYGVERWWVLDGGEAKRVAPGVIPLDTDWWDPLPDRPR